MMGLNDFTSSARNGIFDVRHFMVAGCSVMTLVLVLVSQTNLHARVIDPGVNFATKNTAPAFQKNGVPSKQAVSVPSAKADKKTRTASKPAGQAIPTDFKLTLLDKDGVKDAGKQTRMASLGTNAPVTEFSPKTRTSCSLEAARAAARGDTTKISPCITALLSGDEDAMVNLPEKMGAFFIEAMNDPNAAENMPNIMINSMMKMMEAITNTVEKDSPEKTAATTKAE